MSAVHGLTLALGVILGIGMAAYLYFSEKSPPLAHTCSSDKFNDYYTGSSAEVGSDTHPETRKRKNRKLNNEQCTICLEDFEKCKVTTLPCSHKYHEKCLSEWTNTLRGRICCPICRRRF